MPTEKQENVISSAIAEASPSLAMIKYWGKKDTSRNLTATPSLALTLGGLKTNTEVMIVESSDIQSDKVSDPDCVYIDGIIQDERRYSAYFSSIREFASLHDPQAKSLERDYSFQVRSHSNFPTSAGLASSASGFAALTLAAVEALGIKTTSENLSALARLGSASAARSVWGGFVRLDAGAEAAEPVRAPDWWPELRVVVVQTTTLKKTISSRDAMELTRNTSPFYEAWLHDAPLLMDRGIEALKNRDLNSLGPVIRSSYMRMFSTMFAAEPPVMYWNPLSLQVIAECDKMRIEGMSAWETMDAGPQVKVFCLENEVKEIIKRLENIEGTDLKICHPGNDARIVR